jgi:glycosyl transferase family 87
MSESPARFWPGAVLVVAAAALAVSRGVHEHVGGDFHVFWQAGRNFYLGAPLYHGDLPGARNFLYPPFAAFVFQLLAIFPLQVAATLFSLLTMALWALAVLLTREIVAQTFPGRSTATWPLVLAVVFTAQFFLDNVNLVQVNGLIFALILLGIRAALRNEDVMAALWFVAATAIKVTPVFFVIWLLIRGRRSALLTVPPAAVAAVVVPLLVRGPVKGTAELREFYHAVLEGRVHGTVGSEDENLGGMVYRMMRPTENDEHHDYRLFTASERTAAVIYRGAVGLLFAAFLVLVIWLRSEAAPVSAFELSVVFLICHLLSPLTRKAHLVTLLFVFYTFLAIRLPTLERPGRIGVGILWGLMAVSGLTGRDLVGSTAYSYVGGYNVIVSTMLLLLVGAIVLTSRGARHLRTVAAPI